MTLLPTVEGVAELSVRGSRFFARAVRCSTVDAALDLRAAERRNRHDATHHVFAVRLSEGEFRYDDDGEPAGTAGLPALDAIRARDLLETSVVVVRYFGGTKLGTGGLARAYGTAAAASLDRVEPIPVRRGSIRRVRYDYSDTGAVARVLEALGVERDRDDYSGNVTTIVRLIAGTEEEVSRRLLDATRGRAQLAPEEEPATCWIRGEA